MTIDKPVSSHVKSLKPADQCNFFKFAGDWPSGEMDGDSRRGGRVRTRGGRRGTDGLGGPQSRAAIQGDRSQSLCSRDFNDLSSSVLDFSNLYH